MNEFGYSLEEYNREQLETLLRRYKRSLGSLVVDGSEYWNEPERCENDIKLMFDTYRDMVNDLKEQIQAIERIPVIGWIVKKVLDRRYKNNVNTKTISKSKIQGLP